VGVRFWVGGVGQNASDPVRSLPGRPAAVGSTDRVILDLAIGHAHGRAGGRSAGPRRGRGRRRPEGRRANARGAVRVIISQEIYRQTTDRPSDRPTPELESRHRQNKAAAGRGQPGRALAVSCRGPSRPRGRPLKPCPRIPGNRPCGVAR